MDQALFFTLMPAAYFRAGVSPARARLIALRSPFPTGCNTARGTGDCAWARGCALALVMPAGTWVLQTTIRGTGGVTVTTVVRVTPA